MHQLTTLCPFPGTDLFRKMQREGRIPEKVRWQDLSFFGAGGGFRYKNFESHEIFDIIRQGYMKSYELWGPSLMRILEVQLNGFEWAMSTGDPDLRSRAAFHRRMAMQTWIFLPTAIELAPNGFVRRWLRELAARYQRLFGAPATIQRLMGGLVLEQAKHERERRAMSGRERHVEIPPPRAFRYDFAGYERATPGKKCWTAPYLEADPAYERFRVVNNTLVRAIGGVNQVARLYDHLRRRTQPDREAVDEVSNVISTFVVPL
jgi:hypothetical protein